MTDTVTVTYPDGSQDTYATLDEAIAAAKQAAANSGGGYVFVRGPDDEIDQAFEVPATKVSA